MYHIYVTEGLVLSKRGVGEANVVLQVLTREHGLLRIAARSSRLLRSKQRYGLEVSTLARFSFVRGRNELRLTGVDRASRRVIGASTEARAAFGRIAKLLLRLVHGPEPMRALYDTVLTGLELLCREPTDGKIETYLSALEGVLVLRLMAHLGYVSPHLAYINFIEAELDDALIEEAASKRTLLVRTINDSLVQSGL